MQHVCVRMRLSMLSMVRGRSRRSGPRAASWGGHMQYEASGCTQTSGVGVRRLHLLHSPLNGIKLGNGLTRSFQHRACVLGCPR